MEHSKELSEMIDNYIKLPDSHNFNKIFYLFQESKISIEIIEKLVKARENNIPAYHIGLFYMILKRKLEAAYYINKHVKEHPDDLQAWTNFQYISAQRGDVINSYKAFIKISEIGKDADIFRAELLHLMLIGRASDAVNIAKNSVSLASKDDISVLIIFDLCVMTREWILIPWLIKTELGKKLLSNKNGFKPVILRKVAVGRLVECIRHRIKELEHE